MKDIRDIPVIVAISTNPIGLEFIGPFDSRRLAEDFINHRLKQEERQNAVILGIVNPEHPDYIRRWK
jgi:hypothetical protein